MRCKRQQEAGGGRSEIRSDDVRKQKDIGTNGKIGPLIKERGEEGAAGSSDRNPFKMQ